MWLVLTLTSFATFFVSVFLLARLGFSSEGAFLRRGWIFLFSTLAALGVWLFSLPRVPPPYPLEKTANYQILK